MVSSWIVHYVYSTRCRRNVILGQNSFVGNAIPGVYAECTWELQRLVQDYKDMSCICTVRVILAHCPSFVREAQCSIRRSGVDDDGHAVDADERL
jgi:hypothetical protein